jgi:hypothetical protein
MSERLEASPEEFAEAAKDPEFNSKEPIVVSEGAHGFLLSDGTFVSHEDATKSFDDPGWLGSLFRALLPCK